jgi:hypothetical protein
LKIGLRIASALALPILFLGAGALQARAGVVTVTSPANGSTQSSPVHVVASATSSNPVTAMRIYLDNASVYTVNSNSVNTNVTTSPGTHYMVIVAWDSTGAAFTQAETITVSGGSSGSVTVSSPSNGAQVASTFNVAASATSGYPVTAMRIYLDGNSMYTVNSNSLNTNVTASAGTHNLVVQAWDSSGAVYKNSETITVAATGAGGVTVSSPSNGAQVASPVQFTASATSSKGLPITAMTVYVDNNSDYTTSASSLNTSLSLAAGSHAVVVQAWDSSGAVYKTPLNLTVASASNGNGINGGGSTSSGTIPSPTGSGRNWYVYSSGSDNSSCGTSGAPCATINYVAAKTQAGDVVHVSGSFTLNSSTCIVTNNSGTSSAPITYVADPAGSAHINGNAACYYMWHNLGNYVSIRGFDMTGVQTNANTNSGTSVILSEASGGTVEVAYNTVHDLPTGFAAAINVSPYGSTYTGAPCNVHDNVMHDLAYNSSLQLGDYAFYIACGTNSYVYNNLIYNEGSIGIQMWHAANNVHVWNNTIVNDQYIGILAGTGDEGGLTNAYFDVTNNIVVNSGYGIMAESGTPGTVSKSSIFRNNLVYGNKTDWYYNNNGSSTTIQAAGMSVTGTVTANPMFQASGSNNYQLATGSPAIGKGYNVGLTWDLNGNPVPSATGVNIGAY